MRQTARAGATAVLVPRLQGICEVLAQGGARLPKSRPSMKLVAVLLVLTSHSQRTAPTHTGRWGTGRQDIHPETDLGPHIRTGA